MPRFDRDNSGPRRRAAGPWRNGPIPVIGLIGGIGSGKSLAASAFVEKGAFLLDADAIGHILLDQSPCRDRVLEKFGEAILAPMPEVEGTRRPIDRRALGAIVFSRPEALRGLEALLHPAMRRTFEKAIARETRRARHKAIVLDAAILYEAGWETLCDLVVFIDASPETRLARLESSRGWTAEVLAARENVQGPLEEKRKQADHVLGNDGSPGEFRASIDAIWPQLVTPPRRHRKPGAAHEARGQPSS